MQFEDSAAWVLDRTVKNGFGVMLDDMLAALYTVLALAAVKLLAG